MIYVIRNNLLLTALNLYEIQDGGLIDPDFPGEVIQVSPNPISQYIVVNGLSESKKYFISLYNSSRIEVFSQVFSNSRSQTIFSGPFGNGHYWLKVYDVTKGKVLGSISLVKTR